MAFEKGHPKYGGKKKGSKHVSFVLREMKVAEFEASLARNNIDPVDALAQLIPFLRKNEQAQVYMSLLPYRYPKLKQIEVKQSNPFEGMGKDELVQFARGMISFLEDKTTEPKP